MRNQRTENEEITGHPFEEEKGDYGVWKPQTSKLCVAFASTFEAERLVCRPLLEVMDSTDAASASDDGSKMRIEVSSHSLP